MCVRPPVCMCVLMAACVSPCMYVCPPAICVSPCMYVCPPSIGVSPCMYVCYPSIYNDASCRSVRSFLMSIIVREDPSFSWGSSLAESVRVLMKGEEDESGFRRQP
jgi:hypothetical protein